jgi:hypothetical protein
MDFETLLHDTLGKHYQQIMKSHKGNVSPEIALQVAGMLTAAETHAIYLNSLQQEITILHQTLEKQVKS